MSLKIRDGDYAAGADGRLVTLDGREAVLQRVLFRLLARRGGLAVWPELGSRLHQLSRAPVGQRQSLASQYVSEALAQESKLAVRQVTLAPDGRLEVLLDWVGQPLSVSLEGVTGA